MNLGAIFLLIAMLIVIGVIISRPFLNSTGIGQPKPSFKPIDPIHSSLLAEKERLLSSIQELESDHEIGKIPDDLFPEQRKTLMQETGLVMFKLEQIQANQDDSSEQTDDVINENQGYDDLEEMIAKRRLTLHQRSTGFCQKCGNAVLESDRFCPKCGAIIRSNES